MKTILSLAFLILFASSCKKDEINTSQFYGTWEIRSSESFYPSGSVFYEPGNGTYIELKADGTINRYENAILKSSQVFKITKRNITSCKWETTNYWAIEYESGSHNQIRLTQDTLTISTPPCWQDGGIVTYVRINR